jgi:hypothetical protein
VLLRLDADCVPDERWVEAMVAAFVSRSDVAAFVGGARFIDGPPALRTPLAAAYLGAYGAVATATLGHLPLFGSNMGLRAGAWRGIRSTVHRDDPELHDDLDLAFHLGGRGRIRLLRGPAMGISMRPFGSGRSFARRVLRGFRTVVVHWPADFPPVRWTRLALLSAVRSRRTRRAAAAAPRRP